MKILITAGGTSEKIDRVRKITNTSTGKLGSLIAKEFYNIFEEVEVDYITTQTAIKPNNVSSFLIEDVRSLNKVLEKLLSENDYDIIVHAMAISDYYINAVYDIEDIATKIKFEYKNTMNIEDIKNLLVNSRKVDNSNKISSDFDNLMVSMKKAPKIIKSIRSLQPNAYIVAFKLLDDVSEEELIKVANEQISNYQTNYCLANDLSNINGDDHRGILINQKHEVIAKAFTKQEIAQVLVKELARKVGCSRG